MNTQTQTKLIRQGDYMAEIEVTLTYTDHDWSPYLSLQEGEKLDPCVSRSSKETWQQRQIWPVFII